MPTSTNKEALPKDSAAALGWVGFGAPHSDGLGWKNLSSLVAVNQDALRTRKPFIHAVVAVFSVVAVKNTSP